MKLSKLYTNKPKFKNIKFNPGINVIYADVKTKDENKNSHNLGKSLLIELIDFLLLKKIDNKNTHFFYTTKDDNNNAVFEDYIFYLEVELNSNKFLTIRRNIITNTKISFKLNEKTVEEFSPPISWDHEDIPFINAKTQLIEYLNFDFFKKKSYDYRKAINYCLRKQGDYADIYRLTKFRGKDIDWKPFMFDLLGFNGDLLEKKYTTDNSITEIQRYIDEEEKDFDVDGNEKDEIVGQIQIKENERDTLSNELDNFNFYLQDKERINKLVDDIENNISKLNTREYNIEFEINKIKQSIKNKFAFDINKIKTIFEEVNIYFPDQLTKKYSDLINFNNQLTSERNKLLRETLDNRLEKQQMITHELKDLQSKKASLLSYIQDTDVFHKFKESQKEIIAIESEIISLKSKLDAIDVIGNKQKEIKSLENDLENIIDDIRDDIDKSIENKIYTKIRTAFSNYYKIILDEIAVLSLRINKSNNVDFNEPKVQSKLNTKLMTHQGDGFTYKKLFCVCFDLALLTTYNNQSFYRFVYHDDVFANQDNRPKLKLLNLIYKICQENNLQYIFTIIKDEVPYDEKDKPITFTDEEQILKLHDKNEDGTLFGFYF